MRNFLYQKPLQSGGSPFLYFVVIFYASFIILCLPNGLQGQIIVKGKVLSATDRSPLEGVNIVLKGTKSGTTTNESGEYAIEVRQNFFSTYASDTLVFSYTGFQAQSVSVNGRLVLDILLQPEVSPLAEIIVTGTAVGRSAKTMSYAVGKIKGIQLSEVPSANVGSGLQGKIAGLRVNQTGGQPGQGAFFQIRSANSIANGQQPLIIVDGIFLNGSTLADLNAEDIEKVEVLKGSAGTSLYGSQAANGVIQIFTKRGRSLVAGETRVIYRGEFGVSQESKRYDINNFTNREILNPNGPQPLLGNPTAENTFVTPLPNLQDYQESVLFQTGAFQTNYLAIEGKSDRTNFLASVQRLRDEGILQNTTGYTRHAFRLNADHQVSNKLEVQTSAMFSFSEQDFIEPMSNGSSSFLAGTLFMTPMFDLSASNEEDGTSFDWDIDNTGLIITNPLYDRANARQTVNRSRLLGNFTVNYYAKDWLTLSYTAALDRSTNDYEHFVEKGYLSTNTPGLFSASVTEGTQNSAGGGIHRSNRKSSYFISRTDFLIQKPWGGFNAAIRGSFLYEDLTAQFDEGIGENLAVTGLHSLDNAQSNVFIASEEQEIVGYSGFMIADIDYRQKYIFSGLIRREGTSLFGVDSRWANYYRASAAYRLTEDVNLRFIQDLKIRASMGTSGIRPAFEQRFETFELINGTAIKNTLGNDLLKPSLSTEMEIGVDMTFLKAFDLEFNYAQINTADQILLVPLSGAAGFTGQWRNAGTVEATVYEAGLNTDFRKLFNIKIPDFRWSLYTTFDRVAQVVSQLDVPPYVTGPGIQQSSLFRIEAGEPLGIMIGEVFATDLKQLEGMEGIDPNDYTINPVGYVVRKDQLATPNELPFKLRDEAGNPLVQKIGDINPDFRMGFTHIIGYKGFQIYTLFDWKKGGDIYNMTKHWLYRDWRHGDVSRYPEVAASFYGSDGLYNVLVANNHFVEDGSFFMLREAAISYTFQNGIGNWAKSLKLSLIGRNLFTQTKYSGFHPDITSTPRDENTLSNRFENARGSDARTPGGDPSLFAVDAFNYPIPRTITFSLQVTF